jgi:hypothetical protein
VQFQAQFSRRQASFFYAKARQELRQNYWRALYRTVKGLQIKHAWHELRNGQGTIQGMVTDPRSNIVAFVTFRDGNSFWLTVQSANDPGLAKLQ